VTRFLDSIDVTVADSWVVTDNKTGIGHGEAKIYVGQRTSSSYKDFFGSTGFRLRCRLRKSDLLRFMEEMRIEYWSPSYPYQSSERFREIWVERKSAITKLTEEEIWFSVEEQSHLETTRAYINNEDDDLNYLLLRTLALPNTSILKIVKIEEEDGLVFEFRLMPDFDGYTHRPIEHELQTLLEIDSIQTAIQAYPPATTSARIVQVRVGQQKFKREVLKDCKNTCPFTYVNDSGLLIGSHIKPWRESNDVERLDPKNGLVFTPTYDRLFDNGLISFTDKQNLMISPLLGRETSTKLHIGQNMEIDIPILGTANKRRREYLDYHREFTFRR
jgi:putative restriction endonuclease